MVTMHSIDSTRRIVMGLGLALLLETSVALPAPAASAVSQGGAAQPTTVQNDTPPAKTATKKPRKRRARRRASALRLPAVTAYGIPRLHVKAAYVVDEQTGRVLFQKNQERVMPIASLTKLVTAMVLLDTDPDWDRTIEILPEDVKNSSRTRIVSREEMTIRDLIHAAQETRVDNDSSVSARASSHAVTRDGTALVPFGSTCTRPKVARASPSRACLLAASAVIA
jgi:D-alanyl-D-alanine endopeptidase (penicillin-binding protein 7)